MSLIHIVFGPLGAGKTTYAQQLSSDEKATCFSIDQWMVDLFGADSPASLEIKWVMERVKRCEKRIWLTAKDLAKNGGRVVLDLGFMTEASRAEFIDLASQESLDTKLHFIYASLATRRARVMARNVAKGKTYALEVTPDMFDYMDARFEAASPQELSNSISVDTEANN